MKEETAEVCPTSEKFNINNTLSVVEGNKSFGDDVYRAHKSRIENAHKELYNGIIEQMKDVATTKISRDDAISMRCSTFNEFVYVCKYISVKEDIRLHRVYPALRAVGYNAWYREYMLNSGNIFSDISSLADECVLSFDMDAMRYMSKRHTFFDKNGSDVYKVHKDTHGEAMNRAVNCCISLSDLNLYYALRGLKELIDGVPEYNLLRNKEVVATTLNILNRADKSLMRHKRFLEVLLQ